jgi:thiaminase/transcriptional activator TenA
MTTMDNDTTITFAEHGPVWALRMTTERRWAEAVDHRFVRELFAGSIDDEAMRS